MNVNNLVIDLEPREDSKGNIYFLGRLRFPGIIDLTNGVTLLVFMSESGDEELQIAINDKENTAFNKFKQKRDKANTRLEIRLDVRTDQHDKKFFIAKIQINGYIYCNSEVVFLVFTSRGGEEEVQIVGNINISTDISESNAVEIIRRRSNA